MRKKVERHGMAGTPFYIVWRNMTNRCRYKSNPAYKNYGGRGIEVCDEWRDSFIAFYNDMFESYSPELEIDRIDNGLGYSKDNCRWVTSSVNCNNRRQVKGRHLKGASPYNETGKFKARISVEGIRYTIGIFDTEKEAHGAYLIMHKEWYGQEAIL